MSESAFSLSLRPSRRARIANVLLHLLFSALILAMDWTLGFVSLPAFFGLAFWSDGRLRLQSARTVQAIGKDRAGWWIARADQIREAVNPAQLTVTAMVMVLRWRGEGGTVRCVVWRDSLRDEEYRLLARALRRKADPEVSAQDDAVA